MATTTNFGWETPDDTDLVKDGAAAIRTALGGVDTSFVDLKGGTTGQLLSKASNTDLDYTWIAQPSAGGATLLATATPSASTGVSFTSISTSYRDLYVTWENVYFDQTGDKYLYVRFNNDSGSNYSNYVFSFAGGVDAASLSAQTSTYQNQYFAIVTAATGSGSPLKNSYGYLNVRNYTNTTTPKQFDYQNRSLDNNTTPKWSNAGGVYSGTSAVTQIDFIRNSTQVITGTFKLWGVN